MWPGAAGPCYSGSRCFIGISVGLALVDGLPAAGWATWVPDRSVWAPSVERGGGENDWAGGLTGGALRAGPATHKKHLEKFVVLSSAARTLKAPGLSAAALANVVVVGRSPMANMLSTSRGCPGGGLRWCPRLSAVLGRPHGGSGERRHDGSHQPARTWGRWAGGGVRSGRRRWSPWGLLGPSQGWISPPSRSGCGVGSVARDGRRPGPGSKHLSGGPERPGEPVGRLFRAVGNYGRG